MGTGKDMDICNTDEDKDIVDMNIGRELDMGMAVDSMGRSMDQFSLPVSTAHADAFARAYALR